MCGLAGRMWRGARSGEGGRVVSGRWGPWALALSSLTPQDC